MNQDHCAQILEDFMLRLICHHSSKILQTVKKSTEKDKSEYLYNKMYQTRLMNTYLEQFKTTIEDVMYIQELIQVCDPKHCHSIEKIYQLVALDAFDDIDHRVNPERSEKPKVEIQFFTTFVQSFLRQMYTQTAFSKPFYFHKLKFEEQRDRVVRVVKSLLSAMVHLSGTGGGEISDAKHDDAKPDANSDTKLDENEDLDGDAFIDHAAPPLLLPQPIPSAKPMSSNVPPVPPVAPVSLTAPTSSASVPTPLVVVPPPPPPPSIQSAKKLSIHLATPVPIQPTLTKIASATIASAAKIASAKIPSTKPAPVKIVTPIQIQSKTVQNIQSMTRRKHDQIVSSKSIVK